MYQRIARKPLQACSHAVASPFLPTRFPEEPFKMPLPSLAWVKIESATAEVDGRLEVLDVPKSARHAFDLLNLALKSFAHRVSYRMLVVSQNVFEVPANCPGRLANG